MEGMEAAGALLLVSFQKQEKLYFSQKKRGVTIGLGVMVKGFGKFKGLLGGRRTGLDTSPFCLYDQDQAQNCSEFVGLHYHWYNSMYGTAQSRKVRCQI